MNEKWGSAAGWVKDIALGVALWLLITTFVGVARQIPSGSMEPTILIGDRVWTDKLLLRFYPVERGDIVVFDPPFQSEYPYIKRVIGLPGETVRVENGRVYINDQPLLEPYVADPARYVYGPVQVPSGHYLVLGDNRNESNDGHAWGFLQAKAIKARAVYRFWPLNRHGSLD